MNASFEEFEEAPEYYEKAGSKGTRERGARRP
jgi:hypothetical protein